MNVKMAETFSRQLMYYLYIRVAVSVVFRVIHLFIALLQSAP